METEVSALRAANIALRADVQALSAEIEVAEMQHNAMLRAVEEQADFKLKAIRKVLSDSGA